MRDILSVAKAFSDGSRLRVVMALRARDELCVCWLTRLLRLSMPTVSRHMDVLRAAGVVESRKDGRWVYHRLSKGFMRSPAGRAVRILTAELEDDPKIRKDRERLGKIIGGEKNGNKEV